MGVLWRDSAALSPLSTTLKMRENHLALFALLSCLLAYASGFTWCTCDKSQFQYDTVRGFRYCCGDADNDNCELEIEKTNTSITIGNPCFCEWKTEKLDCRPYISEEKICEFNYETPSFDCRPSGIKKQKNNVCTKSNLGQDRGKMINEGNYEFSCHDDVTAFLEKEDPNYQLVNPCGSCGYDCIDPATGKKGHQWCYVHDDSDCSDMFFFYNYYYDDYPQGYISYNACRYYGK